MKTMPIPTMDEFKTAILKDLPGFIEAIKKTNNGRSAEEYMENDTDAKTTLEEAYARNVELMTAGTITRAEFLEEKAFAVADTLSMMYNG